MLASERVCVCVRQLAGWLVCVSCVLSGFCFSNMFVYEAIFYIYQCESIFPPNRILDVAVSLFDTRCLDSSDLQVSLQSAINATFV